MGRQFPKPVIAQAVVIVTAVIVFSGALTIIGSSPTSDLPERAIRSGNVTATPMPEFLVADTVTQVPGPGENRSAIVTPAPERDDLLLIQDLEVLSLPATFSGIGSRQTQSFRLEPGVAVFDLRHDAPGDFEVWLMCNGSERYDRLLEDGLMAEGPVMEQIIEGGIYFLDVIADGEWQINVSEVPG